MFSAGTERSCWRGRSSYSNCLSGERRGQTLARLSPFQVNPNLNFILVGGIFNLNRRQRKRLRPFCTLYKDKTFDP